MTFRPTVFLFACLLLAAAPALADTPATPSDLTRLPLPALIGQAEELGPPTKFLKELPEDGTPLAHRHIMFGHAYKGQPAGRVLRFCFAKRDDTLEQAAARLRAV